MQCLERITEWGIRGLCGVLLPVGTNLKVINGGRLAETFSCGGSLFIVWGFLNMKLSKPNDNRPIWKFKHSLINENKHEAQKLGFRT